MNHYNVFIPKQAVGANLVYFDVFNVATSGLIIYLKSVKPIVSGAVAVTGVVSVDLHVTRTTAVGTGGTAMTAQGTALTAMTATNIAGDQPLDLAKVSGRLTPTGGATAGAALSWDSVFTEETNAGTYSRAELLKEMVTVNAGTGFRVVQGAVASAGNIGFNLVLCTMPSS